MNWSNVKLILFREVRDQLRDRRTLFMIAVLPLLLYPLLGMSFFQMAQFLRQQPIRVLILGLPAIPDLPPLVEKNHFSSAWYDKKSGAELFNLEVKSVEELQNGSDQKLIEKQAAAAVRSGEYDAVVYFPPDFGPRLEAFRRQLLHREQQPDTSARTPLSVPSPKIISSSANEKSQLAYTRLSPVIQAWIDAIGEKNLTDSQLPPSAARPFEIEKQDIAKPQQSNALIWSKILPFVLLVWALTGAFYPAIDLCAGEKERGTLETLLCSPAMRSEIVTGKLLTVMGFSMATSALNLLCMGLTGVLVISNLPVQEVGQKIGLPPPLAPVWLLLALVPVSALFGALCLAFAAFAKSTKEGQYYLMPLLLVTLPLVMLPMAPNVELNLGNSLIPLTGLMLLLRELLQGNYLAALQYAAPVVGVTLLCCLMAVRWAVDQFSKESVLFRESERLDVGLWLRHLVRDRGDTPSVAEALSCGILILMIRFFLSVAMDQPADTAQFVKQVVVMQLVVIATPALLMTIMLTRSPAQTLLLRKPALWTIPGAALLAIAIHPLAVLARVVVEQMYPISPQVKEMFQGMLKEAPNLGVFIVLLALLPAICEELAFRGFILSGLRHLGRKWRAIVLSALIFGITHSLFQQSLIAFFVGIIIAFVAVQTGSIVPGMVFHFTHNALMLTISHLAADEEYRHYINPFVIPLSEESHEIIYSWWIFGLGLVVAVALLAKFAHLSYRKTEEESLQEAIEQQTVSAA